MFESALLLDKRFVEGYQLSALSKIHMGEWKEAVLDCEKAITYDSDAFLSHYYKGMAYDSLGDYIKAAVHYKWAVHSIKSGKTSRLEPNPDVKEYQIRIGTAFRNAGNIPDALFYYTLVLNEYGDKDARIYYLRGIAHFRNEDFKNALNDFNQSVFIDDRDPRVFYERGLVHQRLSTFQNAIDDFSRAVLLAPSEPAFRLARAASFEAAGKFEQAISDYEEVLSLDSLHAGAASGLAAARQKQFERNREAIPPVIDLGSPAPFEMDKIQIPQDKAVFEFKGTVRDDNPILSISVNGAAATFDTQARNPAFSAVAPVENALTVTVTAADVYDNTSSAVFTVFRTESSPPAIALTTPFATPDHEIFIEADKPMLYMEGTVRDESVIQSIVVEGKAASFELNKLNPVFSITLNVAARDSLTVTATDRFGNAAAETFRIKRESGATAEANPMGRTWAVFIENSNYKNLQSLEGPVRDVTLMKSSLANYRIDKILHRRNLTKSELDKFFSIELRDQLKNHDVRSVLIWFAGHGRFMNETGYWIPVDGVRDDESTLFNLNTLRAYMQSYSNVVHTLVISDACESGPAFYMAMRDIPEYRRCDDWQNTKFRSAQVFTSANAETASDQSVFTETFARMLNSNPEVCIPIENIAVKVTDAVKKNQQQYPRFGKINGLTDEDGTFFFIKK
jgi:Tfp pilus assembly protein PilF